MREPRNPRKVGNVPTTDQARNGACRGTAAQRGSSFEYPLHEHQTAARLQPPLVKNKRDGLIAKPRTDWVGSGLNGIDFGRILQHLSRFVRCITHKAYEWVGRQRTQGTNNREWCWQGMISKWPRRDGRDAVASSCTSPCQCTPHVARKFWMNSPHFTANAG